MSANPAKIRSLNKSKLDDESKNDDSVRLNKFLADSGLCSRRAADTVIAEGRVLVNGKKVFELGIKVHPSKDRITVDGKPVKEDSNKVYFLFHKPKGVLTTLSDPENRPNISHYLTGIDKRVFPVGRLDWDSEGLILLTNDGEWANKIMHPKSEVTKTYLVKLDGKPEDHHLRKLKTGVTIPTGKVKAIHVERVHRKEGSKQYDWIKIVITEGKNRQIRYMFEKIGFDVLKLQRIAIGRLKLGSLQRGELQFLNYKDLKMAFQPDKPSEVKPKKVVSIKRKAISNSKIEKLKNLFLD